MPPRPRSLWTSRPDPAEPVAPPPLDPALPQLGQVLDGGRFRSWLRASSSLPVIDAIPRYVRYKPRNKAIVLYDVRLPDLRTPVVVTVAARRDVSKLSLDASARELAGRCRSRSAVDPPITFLEDPRALLEWYPANRVIPGLAAEPASLRERLTSRGRRLDAAAPELLVYKPERRAVLRWGDCILKAYARAEDFDRAVEGLSIGPRIPGTPVPGLVDLMPGDRLTVQGAIPGCPLPDDARHRTALGEALARLHRSGASVGALVAPLDHLAMARRTVALLRFLRPAQGGRAATLVRTLGSTAPPDGSPVVSHGDLHLDQALLVEAGGLALLDLDHVCMANPALDLATLAAHEVLDRSGDLEGAMAVLGDVLGGYGSPPPRLAWYLSVALLRLAAMPFRLLVGDWPEVVDRVVDAARTARTV